MRARKALEPLLIDRLEDLQVHLLIQHHPIEPRHEIRIQEPMTRVRAPVRPSTCPMNLK